MDVVKEQIGNAEIFGYSFVGNDEDDEVSGWGWFHQTQAKDEMEGNIYFRYGESSDIRIVKDKKGHWHRGPIDAAARRDWSRAFSP